MVSRMPEDLPQIFISHIVQEKPVAVTLKEYLQKAYGPKLPVFVSSDQTSIGGGRKWFDHIISNLRKSKIIVVLVSQESSRREWINFEAGFGDGVDATVIPVAIKNFSFTKLGFPLAGFNGREIGNIEGILLDVTRETGLVAKAVDTLQYRKDVRIAEAGVIYRSLIVKPYCQGQRIYFTITNTGNTDVELLMLEASIPLAVVDPDFSGHYAPNVLTFNRGFMGAFLSGVPCWHCTYTALATTDSRGVVPLRQVLTPSMGTIYLDQPIFDLRTPLPGDLQGLDIQYQIHARNYDTQRETMPLSTVITNKA